MIVSGALILLWVAVACVADICFKNTSGFGDVRFFYGLGLYMVTAGLAVLTFRRIEFGTMTIMWVAASLLVSLTVSVLYYHEKLTVAKAVAAALTLAATGLVNL